MIINCSIVVYKNTKEQIKEVIDCCLKYSNLRIILIDNSPTNSLKECSLHPNIRYIHNPLNPGFGAAHNIAFKYSIDENVKYHIIINPDIYFDRNVIENLVNYSEKNHNIGALMPKIVYPNGRIQRLAKLIPNPLQYFARRFIPIRWIKNKINSQYELIDFDYSYPLDAPFLSGCFLIFRVDVLKEINGFDENIFLYFEDNDICRKILKSGYRTVVFPFVSVIHDHTPKTFFNLNNLKIYFKSGIYYFNKWGWFFDKERLLHNANTLLQIQEKTLEFKK